MAFKETFRLYNDYKYTTTPFLNHNNKLIDIPNDLGKGMKFESKISETFKKEYTNNIEQNIYFFGCSHSIYKQNYKSRLKTFLTKYLDADEIEFIESELNEGILVHNYPFVDEETNNSIQFSLKKRINFLKDKALLLGYSLDYNFYEDRGDVFNLERMDNQGLIEKVDWNGTQTELTALIKSLIESNKLDNSLTEKIIVERFEEFFSYKLKGYDQTKTKIRGRTKEFTPFIDNLKINLENWIKNKD